MLMLINLIEKCITVNVGVARSSFKSTKQRTGESLMHLIFIRNKIHLLFIGVPSHFAQ